MGIVLIAEGTSLNDLHATPYGKGKHVVHGGTFTVTFTTPWWMPVAPLFDSFGSETFASALLVKTKGILRDVEGVGFHTVVLHMEANAFFITPAVLAGLAAVLIAVGIAVVAIKVESPEEFVRGFATPMKWAAVAMVGLAVIVVIGGGKKGVLG